MLWQKETLSLSLIAQTTVVFNFAMFPGSLPFVTMHFVTYQGLFIHFFFYLWWTVFMRKLNLIFSKAADTQNRDAIWFSNSNTFCFLQASEKNSNLWLKPLPFASHTFHKAFTGLHTHTHTHAQMPMRDYCFFSFTLVERYFPGLHSGSL